MLHEKLDHNLTYFANISWGKKGRRKSVPKFFLGKREDSIR